MLGPCKEQQEVESLAFGRPKHQERANSVAGACMVLSTPRAGAGRNLDTFQDCFLPLQG